MLNRWTLTALALAALGTSVPKAAGQEAKTGCPGPSFSPQYASLAAPPLVTASSSGDDAAPAGSECFAPAQSAMTWITVASLVATGEGRDALLLRVGAISQLLTIRYWSTTDREWRPLLSTATALTATDPPLPRADFSVEELTGGADHIFRIADGRTSQAVSYRMRVRLPRAGRVLVETVNLLAIKRWGVTLYAPGGLDTLYVLDERSPGVWAYYSITRVTPASVLGAGHAKSYINRAVALYRHFMRIPTKTEPAAAP